MARYQVYVGYGDDDSTRFSQDIEAESEQAAAEQMTELLVSGHQTSRVKFVYELPESRP